MDDHTQVIQLLLAGLDEAFDRKAWHGATLWGTLRAVSRDEAAWRPSRDRHNIWELTIHCAYWKYIVRRRLTGDRRRTFPLSGSDWFVRPGDRADGDWERDRALLGREHEKLRTVVAALGPADLCAVPGGRDPVHMIRGITAHDIYHTGQIRLLRRLGESDLCC
jgi:uncharacterized damage-inducible protein DinB